ncbi:MAG: ATP-dependent Clp protease adapter ClpS [Pseudomonadota bacterium]
MSDLDTKVKPKEKAKTARPKLYKVILLNDDYTPREFVVAVLAAVFAMGPEKAYHIMATAHQKGSCVVAVFTKDVAETKAAQGADMGQRAGLPLTFTTEREE